jgi:hypothetical protein
MEIFQTLFPIQSQKVFHSCASQILVGSEGTPIRFDRAVPVSILEKLTFQSSKGERKPKYVENGRLLNISSFQGIYRLAPKFIEYFESMLETP